MSEEIIKNFIEQKRVEMGLPDTAETYCEFAKEAMAAADANPEMFKAVVYCYRLAAEKGHALAQGFLGSAYASGVGVGKDLKLAEYWSKKSADQGDTTGMHGLGMIYFGKEDFDHAEYWLKKAIAHGFTDAKEDLVLLYKFRR